MNNLLDLLKNKEFLFKAKKHLGISQESTAIEDTTISAEDYIELCIIADLFNQGKLQ
jgi:hypothetical protein